ncbi:rhodanese-like domain-containing protein [Candidatus Poribacteria bacterium]|nr:rhodanese-like domain-containing protein [Candidatus Poribacteria bacterium]
MSSYQPEANPLQGVSEISRDEVRKRLNDPSLVLVNGLPREAFAVEHIPASINLPVSQINQKAREVLPNLSQEIAVYCASFT